MFLADPTGSCCDELDGLAMEGAFLLGVVAVDARLGFEAEFVLTSHASQLAPSLLLVVEELKFKVGSR